MNGLSLGGERSPLRRLVEALEAFGRFCEFSAAAISGSLALRDTRRTLRLLMPQFYEVGCRTVPVILVTGAFVGMVLAVQSVAQFKSVGVEDRMGVVINVSVVRELGPVLAAVMLAGRIGGALTAELGTMNVTEQIDALRAMGSDPIRYLVVPRFLACLILTPILTLYCDLMGAAGGAFIAVTINHVERGPYWSFTANALETFDVLTGLIKAFVFGGTIGLISCYKGFNCRAGAQGVGAACTEAFVSSFIAILVLDFFLAYFLQSLGVAIWGFKPLF
ncbi:MAG: ABC transporter permease [Phycisphaerae bacterium]|nr:ABC transporter permease [Phycisphaerae bacterium]NUQ45299.1 ABC transporter permease [Phycisphaerae bacterium]